MLFYLCSFLEISKFQTLFTKYLNMNFYIKHTNISYVTDFTL